VFGKRAAARRHLDFSATKGQKTGGASMIEAAPPLVSVVVPTYSRPDLLRACIEAVLGQRCSFPFEVIVVDDGGAPAASQSLGELAGDARVTVVRVANGGPARARNEGIRRARGSFVAFVDDDCAPTPGWLAAAVEAFADDGVVMVQGPVAPPRPASPLAYHFVDTGDAPGNVTANLVVRRQALLAVGGFDLGFPFAAGEDYDLCWRLERVGGQRFATGARVVHALLPRSWRRRRSGPRMWATYFRLYGLHPDRLNGISLPGLRWARAPLLALSPPAWIGAYVTLVPLVEWLRRVRGADPVSALSELAACCLNIAEAVRFVDSYRSAYRTARAEGPRPGLGNAAANGL
jgi:GT2 family glycosyltransferase